MNGMIEILSASFNAGETKTFHISGGYFEVLEAVEPIDVFLLDRHGAQAAVMRKAETSFYCRPSKNYEVVQIASAVAQDVRFIVASGDAGTRRVGAAVSVVGGVGINGSVAVSSVAGAVAVVGTVSVADDDKATAYAGTMFAGTTGIGAAIGYFPLAQLWNPPGSGKRLVVKRASISTKVTQVMTLGYWTSALPSNDSGYFSNMQAAGALPSVAQLRSGALAGTNGKALFTGVLAAGTPYTMDGPIIVNPGYGLTAWPGMAGTGTEIYAAFKFTEEPGP